jgi:hypothetical protein
MPSVVERYLKFAGFSLCVLAAGACAKLAPSDLNAQRPEPRFAEPPIVKKATENAALALSEQMDALEIEMDRLLASAADMRLAIEVMGPLPDPNAGIVHATWPEAARPLPPRTIYRKADETISTANLAGLTLPFPVTADTRLVVSSLPSEGAHGALCVELAALAGRCRPVVPIRAYR